MTIKADTRESVVTAKLKVGREDWDCASVKCCFWVIQASANVTAEIQCKERDREKKGERNVNVTSFGDSKSSDQLLKKHFLVISGNHIFFPLKGSFLQSRCHCGEY